MDTILIYISIFIALYIVIFFIYHKLYNNVSSYNNTFNNTINENYMNYSYNDDRNIKYGDKVTLWGWNNKFIRLKEYGIDVSPELPKSTDIFKHKDDTELFIFENSYNISQDVNSNDEPVRYGDILYIRSYPKSPLYISINSSGNLISSDNRDLWSQFIIVPINFDIISETKNTDGMITNSTATYNVSYGDKVYLKNKLGSFLCIGEQNSVYLEQTPDIHSQFILTDHHGQGENIDWGKSSIATQSSTYSNYIASNAINNSDYSDKSDIFSQTLNEYKPWFLLTFPRDVYISSLVVTNRISSNIDIINRLKDFDILILDEKDNLLDAKHFDYAGAGVTWENINKVGRKVKLKLNGQNYLSLHKLNVFGNTNYNKKYRKFSKDISEHLELNNVYVAHNLPHTRNKLSISFWANIKGNITNSNLLSKGNVFKLNILNNQLQILISGDEYTINTTMSTNGWNHYIILIDGGINSYTGWNLVQFNEPPSSSVDVCCYYVNSLLKQYYKAESNVIYNPSVIDTKLSKDLSYMGKILPNELLPKMYMYMNGILLADFTLTSVPIFDDNDKLVIGSNNLTINSNITLEKIKYYNYILTNNEIKKLSDKPVINTTKMLLDKWEQTVGSINIDHTKYPDISQVWTFSFWLLSIGKRLKTYEEKQIVFSGLFDIFINGDGIIVINNINTNVNMLDDKWHHISISYANLLYKIYIDGILVKIGSGKTDNGLNKIPDFNNSLNINNFNGKLHNIELSNYIITKSKLIDQISNKPDKKYRDILETLWKNNQCDTDVFTSPSYNKWLDMIIQGHNVSVQNEMSEMRYSKVCQ